MEVTIRELQESAAALRRLSSNAKIQSTLFFKLARAWQDVVEALKPVETKLESLAEDYTEIKQEPGSPGVQVYKSMSDKTAHRKAVQQIGDEHVDLQRVKDKIPWSMISENDKAAKDDAAKLNITPVELVSLAWLIDFEAAE